MKQQWEKQPPLKRVVTICLKIGVNKLDPTIGAIKIGEAIDELLADQQVKDIEKAIEIAVRWKAKYNVTGLSNMIKELEAISTLKGEE